MKKAVILLIITALIVSAVSGCMKLEEIFNFSDDTALMEPGFPVSFGDCNGKMITLNAPVTKMVCTDYITLSAAAAVNALPCVAAYPGELKGTLIQTLYPEITNLSKTVPEDAELILYSWDNAEEYKDYQAGLQLIRESEKFDYFFDIFVNMSNAVRYAPQWNEIDKQCKALQEKMETIVRQVDFSARPKVMFLSEDDIHSAAFYGSDAMINDILMSAGGENAVPECGEPGAYKAFTPEEAEKWNPEVIWVPYFADYTAEDVLNDPAFTETTAVKNGEVYVFPGELEPWYANTTAAYLGICWAVHNLYPQLYSTDELIKDANLYYGFMYDISFTPEKLGLK